MPRKASLPRRNAESPISPEAWVSFLALAAVAILGGIGVLLVGQAVVVPFAGLLAVGLALNLALFWLDRRYGPSRLQEWVGRLGNMALITAGLHLSWGLSSPYLLLYTAYIVTGAVRHGLLGALRSVVLCALSLLTLLALGGSLAPEPLVRLAVNVGLLTLTAAIAGSLGQRRIDAMRAVERRAEELAALNEIGRAISARIEVDRLLEEIRRQTGRLMDVSSCYVALLDEETGQLVFPLFYRNGEREEVPPQSQDEGFTGHVVHTREPLLLGDVPQESASLGVRGLRHPCLSWLGVPMVVGEKVLGVVTVQSYERRNAFDSRDAVILQTIAAQAAVALENARLYQETRQRAETFRALAETSRRLTRPAASEDVLAQLPEVLKTAIPFDAYGLYLYQAQPVERMRMVAALGLTPEEKETAERTALERHPGWVVRNRQTLRVEDIHANHRVHYLRPRPPRSILYAPLRYEDRCLGAIGLGRSGPLPFGEADERLLQAVADQAAVAVESTRLYQELEERVEQLYHAHEELRALDRQRTEFVQHVSHELRTPLTFIRGYVELVLQGELGPLTEQQRESLKIVLDKTSLLSRTAEDIVMLQFPQLGPRMLAPISLSHLARAALQGAEATAKAARIILRAKIPDDIPKVLADSRRLMQVFDNLFSNAIKYSPDGGTVTVTVQEMDDAIQVAVQDEGIGIPKDAQTHIFERFYQVDPSRPPRLGGFGLGLTIVKEVIEAHGGRVWVESKVGRGSTFYFTLPKRVDE